MKLLIIFFILSTISPSITRDSFYKYGRSKGDRLYQLKTKEKYIVLSIDDGPSHYTNTILDILDKNDVKATFFLVGSEIESYPWAIKKIEDGGHEIGIHSYTHRNFKNMDLESIYQEEILSFNNIIRENGGKGTKLVRPPYGSLSPLQVQFLKEKGYFVINWSLDTFDWKEDWITSLNVIQDKHHNGGIILMHSNKRTPYLLPELIRELKEKGYTFITVGDFLNQKNLAQPKEDDRSTLEERRRVFLKGSIKKED